MELATEEGRGGIGGFVGEGEGKGFTVPEEQSQSDGGKGVGEDGAGRTEVSTNVTMVAGGGDNRHHRTCACVRIKKRLGHLCKAQYMKDIIGKIRSCSIGWWMRFDESHFPYRVAHATTLSLEEELVRRRCKG